MAKLLSAKTIGLAAGSAAAVGAGVTGLGVATVFGSMLRTALTYRSVDDGPDPLLEQPAAAPRRATVTTADGAVLNVLTYGPDVDSAASSGDVVVMVHGWTCNTDYWLPQINHLLAVDPTRTIVAYDQRGHGDSVLGHSRTTPELLGRDLNAVLGAVLPVDRKAVIMGHSMGGMTILEWAAQFPEQVPQQISHIFLVSTAAEKVLERLAIAPPTLPRFAQRYRRLTGFLVAATPAPTPPLEQRATVVQYIALAQGARAAHVRFVDDMITSCKPIARASCGSALARLDAAAALDALTVPTTVVVGTDDKLLPPLQSEVLANRLRANGFLHQHVVWDGVGHMSSIEAAAEFNALVDAVLAAEVGELAS